MKNLHQLQILILQKLLYSDGLKYSQMKPKDIEGSLFTFHLDQLVKSGDVIKNESNYTLSDKGKEIANRMDLGDESIHSQAKISVVLVCNRFENEQNQLLLYTRHKSPFYGYQGFPTGKVKKGETIPQAAIRELKEETALEGNPKLVCIRHYTIFNKENQMVEDKIFFVCKFDNPSGNLSQSSEGSFEWVDKDKVWEYLQNPVPEIKEILENIDGDTLTFKESSYSTEGF